MRHHRRIRSFRTTAICGSVLAALTLGACGGSSTPSTADEAAGDTRASATAPPSPSPSPTASKPAGPAAIDGTFGFVQKVTKSNMPGYKVGATRTFDAKFTSTCADACTALSALINGVTLEFVPAGDHWSYTTAEKLKCYDSKGKEIKTKGEWRTEVTYQLEASKGSAPAMVSGTVTTAQTKSCSDGGEKSSMVSLATGTQKAG